MKKSICEFVALQRLVLAALAKKWPNEVTSEYLLEIPKCGEITAGTDQWAFRRHGIGVRFVRQRDGTVVDVPAFVTNKELFDAYRIAQYLESTGGNMASERDIDGELLALETAFLIRRSPTDARSFEITI
ncbi:MAG: hypothetical protein ABL985_02760 [Casimicrobium sp.]